MAVIEMTGPRGNIFEYYHKCKAAVLKFGKSDALKEFNKEALQSYEDFFRVYDRDFYFDSRTQEEKEIAQFAKRSRKGIKLTPEEKMFLSLK